MEKFSVDLDKALDDLDFNTDQLEQVASISDPIIGHPILPLQCGIANVFHQSAAPNPNSELVIANIIDGTDIKSEGINIVKEQECISTSIDNIRKSEILPDNLDSLNHFYTHDSLHNDTLLHKQYLNVEEPESTSLTGHNDISQKLLLKQTNDDIGSNQNNCSKKLNQPNIEPSISNVFNNLADYVNSSNVNLVNIDTTDNLKEIHEIRQNNQEQIVDVTGSFINNFVQNSSNPVEKFSIDELLTTQEDLIEEKKDNVVPPKYQNILLPIILDPCTPEKSTEANTNKLDLDMCFPNLLTENSHITNVFDKPEMVTNTIVKNILDEPERVYENVYIGTDTPKTQEFYPPINISRKTYPEFEHTYENANFGTQSIMPTQHNKDGVYECIYGSEKENLPETNTELNITANKIGDQFILKESEVYNPCANICATSSTGASASASASACTKLFQNSQLENSQFQNQEPKHFVNFTTIDDMSEEELNQYLAKLEAEERANEKVSTVYENIPITNASENLKPKLLPLRQDDEDANEAPIFEAVIIGELPQVPQENLQEIAKKFPVIDYSKQNVSEDTSREFSSSVRILESSIKDSQLKNDEIKIDKSLKIHEKVKQSSENVETASQSSSHRHEVKVSKKRNTEKDKENSNYVSTKNVEDKQEKTNFQNIGSEENKNLNYVETTSVQQGNLNDKNLENIEQNISTSSSEKTPIRNTETISRFSVTRNVDVNDKLGGRSKPSQSQSRAKIKDNTEQTESSDDDPARPNRPQTLNVVSTVNMTDTSSAGASYNQESSDIEGDKDSGRAPSPDISENSSMESGTILGKQPPFWVPDSDAPNCMLCDTKFTVMKRRHHCRACGKVLCNKCCNMRYRLEYQSNVDSRVCIPCHQLLMKAESDTGSEDYAGFSNMNSIGINSPQGRQPNPNNPMEYCSTIPPLQQLAGGLPPPPTVMVPVGVLKREGSSKQRSEGPKSVMFSDGIRPGCDLTELDTTWDWKPPSVRKVGPRRMMGGYVASSTSKKSNCPQIDLATNSYTPQEPGALPPTVTIHKGQVTYHEVTDTAALYASLKNECEPPVMFAINRNLYAYVKIVNLNCCVNRICWNVTSKGLACFGQDEVVFLIETLPDETDVPKDLLLHINQLYHEAMRGNQISEYGMSIHQNGKLLGDREHAGFLFIRQTLQCLQKIITPPTPFLIGLLIHRWETPWAKIFPLRLVLRLGAEYRYYPCPLVSVRFRDAVYFELGHTIIRVLADFRNFAYTLPKVQGLTIHMQDNTTHVRFPKNRYNQVIKGLNNSNDHVLAFASNFSIEADSHFVCMQTNSEVDSTYQTQAINIQNKPRKVTGASFIVINGALKSSMGLSAKSRIVEDGITVQIMPEKMEALKAALKNMQDFTIGCGLQGAPEPDEIVHIKWVENDTQFNIGVKSPIDGRAMDGIPSIRVHNITNCVGTSRFIRWTELFIIKSDDDQAFGMHYKLSESIARATCVALVKLLDLLANAGLTKIAVRTTIHPDNVGYEAGSEGTRLPPIYMNSLDNELIKVLQKAVQGCEDTQTVLELIFYILEEEI